VAFRIEVVSDVVCPWCFIGKRRLEQALQVLGAEEPDAKIDVVWRPFELNPQLPPAGMERSRYLELKFGSRAEDIYARVRAVGQSVGIEFAFERIARQPNTLAAHQLIDLAREHAVQDSVVEALFRAYFLDGVDLSQADNLIAVAAGAGVDAAAAAACLADDGHRAAISEQEEHARELGVGGVPFFIFGGQLAVSGAQEAQTLVRAFRQAVATV
jgi:predicted DsbA family dithiol-disulfide isomerase